jgi:oxalate decarboxylase/phosphoglucose isomerase-like protein (cupin superfamily)
MNYNDTPFTCLHSYIVIIEPGKTRAKHYHILKEEWVALAAGKIHLFMENTQTKEKSEICLDINDKDYGITYLPPMTAHALKNVGDGPASVVIFSKTPEVQGDTIPYELGVI